MEQELIVIETVSGGCRDRVAVYTGGEYAWSTCHDWDSGSPTAQVFGGSLPALVLEPVLAASSSFPLRDGVRVYVDYLDTGKTNPPAAVKVLERYVQAMHVSGWSARYSPDVVASVVRGCYSMEAAADTVMQILSVVLSKELPELPPEFWVPLDELAASKQREAVAQVDALAGEVERGHSAITPDPDAFHELLLKMASHPLPVELLIGEASSHHAPTLTPLPEEAVVERGRLGFAPGAGDESTYLIELPEGLDLAGAGRLEPRELQVSMLRELKARLSNQANLCRATVLVQEVVAYSSAIALAARTSIGAAGWYDPHRLTEAELRWVKS